LGAVLVLLTASHSPVLGDADQPSDWSVATPTRSVLDAVWSNDRIYAAVEFGGLLIHDPDADSIDQFTTFDGLGSNLTRCVGLAPDGELWVGTADAGITRIDPEGRTRFLTALPDQLDVRALAFSGSDTYYGGPAGGGRIANGLPERSFTTSDGLVSDDVRAVAARATKAWFGTAAGISEFDIQRNDLVTRNEGLTDLDVRVLAVAGDRLYAGTGTALWVLDEDAATPTWAPVDPPINAEIVDLAVRNDLLVVLATDRRAWWRSDPGAPWAFEQIGSADQRLTSVMIDDEGAIRAAGRRSDRSRIGNDVTPVFITRTGGESSYYRRLYGTQFLGMAADRSGGAWVGAFPVDAGVSHWRADGSVVAYDAEESGNALDGFVGDGWLPKLKVDLFEASDGSIWVSSFQEGVTRMVPAADGDPTNATYTHITSDNSPLDMNRVVSMGEDPFGHIWFCAAGEVISGSFNSGIDVLLDPDAPELESNWVHLRSDNSELAGDGFYAITFEGNRVAWLTVRNVGLQRFEYGDGTGFSSEHLTDPLRWDTIRALPEFGVENLSASRQVVRDAAGRHWVATKGEGLFSFEYDAELITLVRQYTTDSFGARLLSSDVFSVAVDGYGDVWAATALGLNRIRVSGNDSGAAAFTDLQNFLEFGLGEIYSLQILRPMAGGVPVSVRVSPTEPLLFAASARGLTRVNLVPDQTAPPDQEQAKFSIYPNPVRAEPAEVVIEEFVGDLELVEIYDLQGRAIRRIDTDVVPVEPGDVIWRATTASGEPVANGLYLVRVVFRDGGESSSRVLAVER
jgi:hypothetical protein